MTKKAIFTMKLEFQLRDEFMAAAADDGLPASQKVVGSSMKSMVKTYGF